MKNRRTSCKCFYCQRGRETFQAVGVPKDQSILRFFFPKSKRYLTVRGAERAKTRMEKDPKFEYVELWRIAP